jgi:hypothetical protein
MRMAMRVRRLLLLSASGERERRARDASFLHVS